MDPAWTIGTYWKPGLWTTYATLNYTGSVLCLLVIISLSSRNIKPHEVFMSCLCLGCLLMGIPCASQCAINLLSGTLSFQFGQRACWWEAFFHLEAIQMQFFGVALVACYHYLNIVRRKAMSSLWALAVTLFVIVFCAIGTYLMGTISQVQLMPAGAYCFYTFASPLIVYWFTPGMLIAAAVVIVSYAGIFCFVARVDRAVAPMVTPNRPSPSTFSRSVPPAPPPSRPNSASTGSPGQRQRQLGASVVLGRRTSAYVAVFLVGWGPAVIACLYTVATGSMTQALDITLAVCGSLHTVAVPLVYGYHTPKFRDWLRSCCCRCRRRRPAISTIVINPKMHIVVDTVAPDGSPVHVSPDPSSSPQTSAPAVVWVRSELADG